MQNLSEASLAASINGVPLKRLADPNEIANVIVFLASEEQSVYDRRYRGCEWRRCHAIALFSPRHPYQFISNDEVFVKITKVNAYPLRYPEPNDYNNMRHVTLAKIETDEGVIGWGECISQWPEAALATKAHY